jgi:hypothetical protein
VVPEKKGAAFSVGIFGERTAHLQNAMIYECSANPFFKPPPSLFFFHDRSISLLKTQRK